METAETCIAPLFVPADRPERFAKAAASGADALIIDLEDAVAPGAKAAARDTLQQAGILPAGIAIFLRLNGWGTPWHGDDAAVAARLDLGVMLPKAESPTDIAALAARLGGRKIIALIETAAGLAAARAIAQAPGTARLAFGSIDFCADLGMSHTREALLFARSELVLASRLAGRPAPLDGVTTAVNDSGLAEADASHGSRLGFGGKLCIHPAQVAPVLRGFAPSETEIAWARRMLGVAEAGAAAVDGAMVDAPVRAQARRILARQARGLIDGDLR